MAPAIDHIRNSPKMDKRDQTNRHRQNDPSYRNIDTKYDKYELLEEDALERLREKDHMSECDTDNENCST